MTITANPVVVNTDYTFIKSMDAFALYPQVYDELIRSRGNLMLPFLMSKEGGIVGIKSTQGMGALEFNHLEDDWSRATINVNTFGGGAPNATVTLTLQAASEYTYPGSPQSPYIVTNAVTTNPVILKQTYLFSNGVEGIVTAVTSTTFDIAPLGEGVSIPPIATTDDLVLVGNSHEEGSGQPLGTAWRQILYTGNMQELKRSYRTTTRAMQQKTWVNMPTRDGGEKRMYWSYALLQNWIEYNNDVVQTMLVGQNLTNTTLAATLPTTITTQGMIPTIQANGNNYGYSPLNGFTLADLDSLIITKLDRERASMENNVWAGITVRRDWDNFMADTMKNGGISYGSFGGDQKKAIDYGFDSCIRNGYTFHLNTYQPFNYKKGLGATNFVYPSVFIVAPADEQTASFTTQGKLSVPSWRLNYLKNDEMSAGEWMVEWATGTANGVFNTEDANWNQHERSTFGLEMFALNRWAYVAPNGN